jgi:hypothetical protein
MKMTSELVTVDNDIYTVAALVGSDTGREPGTVCLSCERGQIVDAKTGETLVIHGWGDLVGWGELSGESTIVSFGSGPQFDIPRAALLNVATRMGVEIAN